MLKLALRFVKDYNCLCKHYFIMYVKCQQFQSFTTLNYNEKAIFTKQDQARSSKPSQQKL